MLRVWCVGLSDRQGLKRYEALRFAKSPKMYTVTLGNHLRRTESSVKGGVKMYQWGGAKLYHRTP